MSKRSYRQNCALALGLDIIGERWTLLIIRGLLTGPMRYSDLLDHLPSMGTNLLAARLKSLRDYQVIEQTRDAGGNGTRYSLTERGEQLRPIVHALIRWGHQFRELADADAIPRPEWDMLAIEAAFRPRWAKNVACVIDLTLDEFRFHIVIEDQAARCVTGPAEHPDVVAALATSTLLKLGEGEYDLKKTIDHGELTLSGSRRAFRLLFKLFEL